MHFRNNLYIKMSLLCMPMYAYSLHYCVCQCMRIHFIIVYANVCVCALLHWNTAVVSFSKHNFYRYVLIKNIHKQVWKLFFFSFKLACYYKMLMQKVRIYVHLCPYCTKAPVTPDRTIFLIVQLVAIWSDTTDRQCWLHKILSWWVLITGTR